MPAKKSSAPPKKAAPKKAPAADPINIHVPTANIAVAPPAPGDGYTRPFTPQDG